MVMGLLRWGFLKKQGGSRKAWKKRWFVLTAGIEGEDPKFSYYKTPKDTEALGTIIINSKVKVRQTSETRFELDTLNRTYFLYAPTEDDCIEWVDILNYIVGERVTEGSLEDAFMLKMSGYLSTQVGLLRNWKTHYYVLEARRLCYYRNETKLEPQGAINLKDCTEVGMLSPDCFGLVCAGKIHYFCSDDGLVLDDWVAVLKNAIDFANLQKQGSKPQAPKRRDNPKSNSNPPPPPTRTVSKKDENSNPPSFTSNDVNIPEETETESESRSNHPEPSEVINNLEPSRPSFDAFEKVLNEIDDANKYVSENQIEESNYNQEYNYEGYEDNNYDNSGSNSNSNSTNYSDNYNYNENENQPIEDEGDSEGEEIPEIPLLDNHSFNDPRVSILATASLEKLPPRPESMASIRQSLMIEEDFEIEFPPQISQAFQIQYPEDNENENENENSSSETLKYKLKKPLPTPPPPPNSGSNPNLPVIKLPRKPTLPPKPSAKMISGDFQQQQQPGIPPKPLPKPGSTPNLISNPNPNSNPLPKPPPKPLPKPGSTPNLISNQPPVISQKPPVLPKPQKS